MEKFGSSYDESFNANLDAPGDKDKSRGPSGDNSAISKKPSKILLYEDVDVDSYMTIVEDELKKMEYSLHNRAFIENIINILDKLIAPKKFNKTIFFHVLDFASLNTESPVLLLDFFRSFFTVYESMKKNRDKLAQQATISQQKIETTKTKIIKIQNEEVVTHSPLTNLSQVKVELVDSNLQQGNLLVKFGNESRNFKDANTNTKAKSENDSIINKKVSFTGESERQIQPVKYLLNFKVNTINELENEIKIFTIGNGKENYIDKVNISDCLNKPCVRKFTSDGNNYELKFLFVDSKVNHLNKKIVNLEEEIKDSKENIALLSNCITHIEDTFRKYFNARNNTNPLEFKLDVNDPLPNPISKELEISDKIEDYVLKIVGREVIIMDKIVFFLNKIILLLLIFVFLNRFDILTNWNMSLLSDGNNTGNNLRKFVIVFNSCMSILKIIVSFCLWRIALEYKLLMINKQIPKENDFRNAINKFDNSKSENFRKSAFRSSRPQLRQSVTSPQGKVHLREYNESDDFRKKITLIN